MVQTKNNTKKSSYKHLSFKERQLIEVWHNMGDSNREIGKRSGWHHQTINNELNRTTINIDDDENKFKEFKKIIQENSTLKQLSQKLLETEINIDDTIEIILYFQNNPLEEFNMEVIQQQLTWMEHVKNQETGISSLATYFINGYKKRVANSELHLKPGFIIDTEMTPKVPLFRWVWLYLSRINKVFSRITSTLSEISFLRTVGYSINEPIEINISDKLNQSLLISIIDSTEKKLSSSALGIFSNSNSEDLLQRLK